LVTLMDKVSVFVLFHAQAQIDRRTQNWKMIPVGKVRTLKTRPLQDLSLIFRLPMRRCLPPSSRLPLRLNSRRSAG